MKGFAAFCAHAAVGLTFVAFMVVIGFVVTGWLGL